MVKEISLGFAVEMANDLHRKGTSMGLAIYKAAKYFEVDQHELAVKIGRLSYRHQSVTKPHGLKPNREQAYWWDNG